MFGNYNFKKLHKSLDNVQMALRVRPEFTDQEESSAYFDHLQNELAKARRYMDALLQTKERRSPVEEEVREPVAS